MLWYYSFIFILKCLFLKNYKPLNFLSEWKIYVSFFRYWDSIKTKKPICEKIDTLDKKKSNVENADKKKGRVKKTKGKDKDKDKGKDNNNQSNQQNNQQNNNNQPDNSERGSSMPLG